MIYQYRNVNVFYKFVNHHKDVTNIFLHGWGASMQNLMFCKDYLTDANTLFIDFPPFGKSGKNPYDWTIFTYANMVISLCEKLNIKKFNLVGHSFGGRVAIIVASIEKAKTQKLVLVDSAGVRPRRSVFYYLKVWSYKIKKKLKLSTGHCGSEDYQKLNQEMKKVFVGIVNTHLDEFLPLITTETLIIFGKQDKVTPIYMAKTLKKKIKNSHLSLINNTGHFCFIDKKLEFVSLLKNFLK